MSGPRKGSGRGREFPRTARLNELLREIVADELERIDDDRLQLLTITSVEVDRELMRALVRYTMPEGFGSEAEVSSALAELKGRVKVAIGRQARIRRVPDLVFLPDDVLRQAYRIDEILRADHEDRDGDE